MKLKTLAEEMDFVRDADIHQLVVYVSNFSFRPKTEKELVLRGLTQITCYYIKKHGLSSPARIALFRSNHAGLIAELLHKYTGSSEVINEFLNHGVYSSIKHFMNLEYGISYPEAVLVENSTQSEIISYIWRHKMSAFARLELIMRGNPDVIDAIILKKHLNEREKLTIMEKAPWKEAALLVDTEKKCEQKKLLQQLLLIRFSSSGKVAAFIAKQRFCKTAEAYFFKQASFELLVNYVKHYQVDGGQEFIINRGEKDKILNYLSKNQLSPDCEKLLLNRGNHREIKAYVKSFYFSEDNEVRFIKRGNHKEIMLYISRHSLCDMAQVELLYRRNPAEIMYFVSTYPLADVAEATLMRCGTPEQIRTYMENSPL